MKKILVTWASGMLASDFQKYAADYFDITALNKTQLDITNIWDVQKKIIEIRPDCVLNCAAYTNVDEAEGVWRIMCHEVNTLWVQNLAKITSQENIDFITLSTDYVFDGKKSSGYLESDGCHPINYYWQSKYDGECLAIQENPQTIIVRTSWLYWGWPEYNNFINTVVRLIQTKKEIKIVNDVFWSPTNCADLVWALVQVLCSIEKYHGRILHFSNNTVGENISWYNFAKEICKHTGEDVRIMTCSHDTYLSKAKRPINSRLINTSDIVLKNWKDGVKEYIDRYFIS